MDQIHNLNTQIIDDDSLIRIFSFIPPIPFFFTTMPLINKHLFQYFFNFVTTCGIEELNYFREVNFWEFGCSLEEVETKEHINILENHFKLLFGAKNNNFFNSLHQRILETTETIFLPWWRDIALKVEEIDYLTHFKNLKTIVFPSFYSSYFGARDEQGHTTYQRDPDTKTACMDYSSKKKIQKQNFIFLNWDVRTVQLFFGKYFNAFDVRSQQGKTQNIPQIEKIVLVGMSEVGGAATEETRKKFQNSNFFLKKTPYESLLISENANEEGKNQNEQIYGQNALKIDKSELEEFKRYSGFKKETLELVKNHPEVNLFDFSIAGKCDQRLLAILDYFLAQPIQASNSTCSKIHRILENVGMEIDYVRLLLSVYFLDGWASLSDFWRERRWDVEYDGKIFCEFFNAFKKKTNISMADHIELVKIGQEKEKNEEIVLYDYANFINDNCLNISRQMSFFDWGGTSALPHNLLPIVKSMHWDILRISFLQTNLDNLIENSRLNRKDSKKILKELRKLWKTCFSVQDFGSWMMEFDHVMIFKLWEKLDTDLVRKIFYNDKLHYIIPFLLDRGEPNDSPNFAGILNIPSPKTGELPIDVLLKKNPYYAIAIANGKLHPIGEKNESELTLHSPKLYSRMPTPHLFPIPDFSDIVQHMKLHFKVKRISNQHEINEKFTITKLIQSGETGRIPFDLIHDGVEAFPIEDIVVPLQNQIPPEIYELSNIKDLFFLECITAHRIDLQSHLENCLHHLDDEKTFVANFSALTTELETIISHFEVMFQDLMRSAHILKNMFDKQKEAKTGKKHSFSTFLDSIENDKLDLFPQLPKNQTVRLVGFKIRDGMVHDSWYINVLSSEYAQEVFRRLLATSADWFESILAVQGPEIGFDVISDHLIDLASKIYEKESKSSTKSIRL